MNDDLEISAGLRKTLRDVATRDRLEIPDAVDAAVRVAARRRPRGRLIPLRRAIAAAAAALLLGIGVWAVTGPSEREAPSADRSAGALEPGDLDADGRVDIVDAYLLDRGLDAKPARGDVDGNGRVDRADVRRLVERVVALDGRNG